MPMMRRWYVTRRIYYVVLERLLGHRSTPFSTIYSIIWVIFICLFSFIIVIVVRIRVVLGLMIIVWARELLILVLLLHFHQLGALYTRSLLLIAHITLIDSLDVLILLLVIIILSIIWTIIIVNTLTLIRRLVCWFDRVVDLWWWILRNLALFIYFVFDLVGSVVVADGTQSYPGLETSAVDALLSV